MARPIRSALEVSSESATTKSWNRLRRQMRSLLRDRRKRRPLPTARLRRKRESVQHVRLRPVKLGPQRKRRRAKRARRKNAPPVRQPKARTQIQAAAKALRITSTPKRGLLNPNLEANLPPGAAGGDDDARARTNLRWLQPGSLKPNLSSMKWTPM